MKALTASSAHDAQLTLLIRTMTGWADEDWEPDVDRVRLPRVAETVGCCHSVAMPYTALKHELDRLTSGIWRDVTTVRKLQGPWKLGEVTVTERLHLDLLHSGLVGGGPVGGGLVIYDLPDEPTTGADWEWLVQVPGTQSFLRYRIQAKILAAVARHRTPRALRFAKINYRNQRAILLASAQADGFLPFYAYYVGDPWPQTAPVDLPPWRVASQIPNEHFGCTAVPADDVDGVCAGPQASVSEATQYLTLPSGRRLSDLFPSSAATPAGSHPPGGISQRVGNTTSEAPSIDYERAKGLSQDQVAMLAQLKVQAAAGGESILIREPASRESTLRGTAIFTAE